MRIVRGCCCSMGEGAVLEALFFGLGVAEFAPQVLLLALCFELLGGEVVESAAEGHAALPVALPWALVLRDWSLAWC